MSSISTSQRNPIFNPNVSCLPDLGLMRQSRFLRDGLFMSHAWTPVVVVAGSTDFDYGEGDAMISCCRKLGNFMALRSPALLVTGGMPGVGAEVSRSFLEAGGQPDRLYHVLPRIRGLEAPDPRGTTLRGGIDYLERRVVLGCMADYLVLIGGGPGTVAEANMALSVYGTVLPIGCTGGAASGVNLHSSLPASSQLENKAAQSLFASKENPADWEILTSYSSSTDEAFWVVEQVLSKAMDSLGE